MDKNSDIKNVQLSFAYAPDLKELFFPVKLVPIYTHDFVTEDRRKTTLQIDDYLAVINLRTSEIYSVVSTDYLLLPNEEALEIGKDTFVRLFPIIKREDLVPFNVIASKRKTFCHIDLVHKDVRFDVWAQETWFPFLRVTNSYNKTYAFTIEMGFVKELTSSGIIFDKKTVEVKRNHNYSIGPWNIGVDISSLQKVQAEFVNYMLNLKRFLIPSKYIFPLVLKALGIEYREIGRYQPDSGKQFTNSMVLQLQEIEKVRYMSEALYILHPSPYGESAYAAFNTILDVVNTHGKTKVFQNYSVTVRSLNENLSKWIKSFTDAIEKRDFDPNVYLKNEIAFIKKVDAL